MYCNLEEKLHVCFDFFLEVTDKKTSKCLIVFEVEKVLGTINLLLVKLIGVNKGRRSMVVALR